MSTADWRSAYWRDQRYPAGIDGRSHVPGVRYRSAEAVAASRHLRRLKSPDAAQVKAVVVLRRHSITVNGRG